MSAEDLFGSSGRAPDEQDFRGGCALSVAAPSADGAVVWRYKLCGAGGWIVSGKNPLREGEQPNEHGVYPRGHYDVRPLAEMSTTPRVCLETGPMDAESSTSAGTERQHHAALQRIGYALGLLPGADLHQECVPAIEALKRAALIQGATSLNQGSVAVAQL